MKLSLKSMYLMLPLLTGFGVQPAAANPSDSPPGSPARLTADEIVSKMVARNLERTRALRAYEGTRVYRLEYRGFPGARNAEMVVDVKFHAPGMKEFTIRSEKGSKVIIERVFKRMLQTEKDAGSEANQAAVALTPDNYHFTLAGYETKGDSSAYILAVEPRTDNKLLYRGRVWVQARDFAVMRIEATPAQNPSFWTKGTKIEQVYAKVGDFWLPVTNRSSSEIRLGGHAIFTIDYQNYRITSAIPLGKAGEVAGSH